MMAVDDGWLSSFASWLMAGRSQVHAIGIGNPMRGDDAAGLELAKSLRTMVGRRRTSIKVHAPDLNPERTISKVPAKERILIFDAVQAGRVPGTVVCARLTDTKYGFFGTHNVPLRLIPGLAGRQQDTLLLGIQPGSMEVGEGLSAPVNESVALVASEVAKLAVGG